MRSTCRYLGIHVDQIDSAGETAELVCRKYHIYIPNFWDDVLDDLSNVSFFESGWEISDLICDSIFSTLKEQLEERGVECDYYVNGTLDTHFYIDGESV